MNRYLGLIEAALVLLVVFGWGIYELRSLKKPAEKPEENHEHDDDEGGRKPPR